MTLGTATVIQGNALNLPLPDSSVDLICTSPPYFGLRSYQDNGTHYAGQIGSEPTPAEWLDALLAATREMVRVLKPSGSIFVNLGDKYAGSQPSSYRRDTQPLREAVRARTSHTGTAAIERITSDVEWGTIPTKSLMGMPWRYAIACIDQLELILRAEIIWSKPNGLPESVTDRVRRSHEQWFHFTVQPRYFAVVDEIREPHSRLWDPAKNGDGPNFAGNLDPRNDPLTLKGHRGTQSGPNPLGKLPGSVWTIPTQPLDIPPELGVDHFAAYPMEWPRRIIQGWSPSGICTVCGEGRRPIGEESHENIRRRGTIDNRVTALAAQGFSGTNRGNTAPLGRTRKTVTITNYICSCIIAQKNRMCGYGDHCPDAYCHWDHEWITPPTRPAVVLDPFGGTGTTALVAKALGRIGITVDLSRDYCRMAEWRCNNPQQLAAALQVEKPEPVPDGQLALFDVTPTSQDHLHD